MSGAMASSASPPSPEGSGVDDEGAREKEKQKINGAMNCGFT
jgi:hypothetical protein